jgi:hypothetical protein
LTRILNIHKYNLHTTGTGGAITLLLFLTWKEEELLGTTLDTVKVVVHVEETDRQSEGSNDNPLNLSRGVRIKDNHRSEDHLYDSELGDGGHGKTFLEILGLCGGSGSITRSFWGITWHLLCMEKIMWNLLLIPVVMVIHDYMKAPIDKLYFSNWKRPMIGIRNTFIDVLLYSRDYSTWNFKGLWLVKTHFKKLQKEFEDVSKKIDKHYYHDLDPWFEKNEKYYYYKGEDFPLLKSLIDQIPSIYKWTCAFAVMEGPMTIPPHRAETNHLLRYHITIIGDGDCTLYTENGPHVHREGEDFLFDHSRYHEVIKTGNDKRVVLIIDVNRF